MKQTTKYAFAIVLIALMAVSNLYAVAPRPGLNLTEPMRQPVPQGIVEQEHIRRMAQRSPQSHNLASRGLLIVVEFADHALAEGNTIASFDSLANADEYTYNGAIGSCKKYYQDQSNGLYSPTFDVVGPVVLPQTLAYYGTDAAYEGDDRYIVDFVLDACKGAQAMGVDFSNYDQNEDGIVDLIYIIYAGFSQADGADAITIWPHAWDIQSALAFGNTNQTEYFVKTDANGYIIESHLPEMNGKTILKYACSNELIYSSKARSSIGTICHEFGHVLGLADLYRTDGSSSNEVPGSWALMSHGNYLNNGNTPPNLSTWEKYFLGWATPSMLSRSQQVELPADGKSYYMLNRTSIVPEEGALTTDTMYYFENRQKAGWDEYLPGWGMLVWRIVYDEEDWFYNQPNNNTTRFYLVTSNGSTPYTSNLSGGKRQDVPFPGSWFNTEFKPYEHAYLSDITEEKGMISFQFTNTSTDVESPVTDAVDVDAKWYNLLGQPIDIHTHQGMAISKGSLVLLK